MLRKALLLATLASSGVLVALVLAEVLVRLTGLASPPVAVSADEDRFAAAPGAFLPAPALVDRRNASLPHVVSINALGFRGADVSRSKGSGERRVLFIGDSFTWGDYVDDDSTLPAQFERIIGSACSGVRSLNFGLGGTTIDAQLAMLERGLTLAPDLVVLVFHDNDVRDLEKPTYWEQLGENRRRKSAFPASFFYRIVRRTALWSVLRRAVARAQTEEMPPASATGAVPVSTGAFHNDSLRVDSLRAAYHTGLRSFVARVALAGVPLVVTAFPSHLAFKNVQATDYGWFASTVAADSLDFVDPLPPLMASGFGLSKLYLFPHDAHASARGYNVLASALSARVLASPGRARLCGDK